MTSLPYKVLMVLFLISRRQFLPSSGKPEGSVKPATHVLDVKTPSPWLQSKAANTLEPKSCEMFNRRHYHHSQVSDWTGSMHDISTYITSRDSTPSCTQTDRLLVLKKHEKLENAALRENYRHNGAITEIKEVVGSTVTVLLKTVGSVFAHLKNEKVDCGRTLSAPTEWQYGGMLDDF